MSAIWKSADDRDEGQEAAEQRDARCGTGAASTISEAADLAILPHQLARVQRDDQPRNDDGGPPRKRFIEHEMRDRPRGGVEERIAHVPAPQQHEADRGGESQLKPASGNYFRQRLTRDGKRLTHAGLAAEHAGNSRHRSLPSPFFRRGVDSGSPPPPRASASTPAPPPEASACAKRKLRCSTTSRPAANREPDHPVPHQQRRESDRAAFRVPPASSNGSSTGAR